LKTLDPAPSEILITADGCSDGTVRFLRDSCPEFHLIVHDISRGSVASGAAMMEKAPDDLVLALDDDSYPEQSDCLSTLSDLFSQNARVAVATLPQRTPTAHCLALSQCFSTCTKNRITHYSA
jgi:cellulose synthase/poly-beta-1,6-N-acetylglucosamine synthase-like glycosyltransferase